MLTKKDKSRGVWPILSAAIALALYGSIGDASAKTLVYCIEGSPDNFYSALSSNRVTHDAAAVEIFEPLVDLKRGTDDIEPALAESYETSADGLTVTFHLRKGVKFQTTSWFAPTRDFNADDVLFSFQRQYDQQNPYYRVTSANHTGYDSRGFNKLIKSVEKVDDYTVRFNRTRRSGPFLAQMTSAFTVILSKEYADKLLKAGTPEKIDQEPVGTGPFYLVDYQKDSIIRYKAHPGYWRGKAPIDDLIFSVTPDASVRWQKIKAGECDVMPFPNPADLKEIRTNPDVVLLEQSGLNIGFVAFDTLKKPFDDKRVRQAINLAVNKKAILESVYFDTAIPAINPLPPGMWGYNDAIKDYPYDPEKAKALLAEAGYPNGFTTDEWAIPIQRSYNPNGRRIAERMQADLSKIGVTVEIKSYEWSEFQRRAKNAEHQMAQWGWNTENSDPDNFMRSMLGCDTAPIGGSNVTHWCNKQYDDLVMEAEGIEDVEKRTELYKQAQVIAKEEAPILPIAHVKQYVVVRKNVVGFKLDPTTQHEFYGVDVKE